MTLIGFAALISMLWLVTNAVRADEAQPTSVPFDISLIHPVNFFHPDKKSITGLSLNVLHGTTTNLYGVEMLTVSASPASPISLVATQAASKLPEYGAKPPAAAKD